MAAFPLLAPELLAHILKLSTEGESAEKQQRARFSFGLIARAFYLATADATDFHVAGEKNAKALISKLEREKNWAAQEERKATSGRTTRATLSITRVSVIRRLSFVLEKKSSGKVLASLLRATPNLSDLTLDIQHDRALTVPASLDALEVALGALTSLRRINCKTMCIYGPALLRILIPLKELQALELHIYQYSDTHEIKPFLDRLALPRLCNLRILLHPQPTAFSYTLFATLVASSTTEMQVLDLGPTPFYAIPLQSKESFIPQASHLLSFTWTPEPEYPLDEDTRAAVLELLGAMTSLRSITIPVWQSWPDDLVDDDDSDDSDDSYSKPEVDKYEEFLKRDGFFGTSADPQLLDTLATLPSLHTVQLLVQLGNLREGHVVSFIEQFKSLRVLHLVAKLPHHSWTREQRRRVEEAGEGAGVTFKYEEKA
ncbi:hypothetical protein RQP46_003239 [Phenoliferia psychrophenolica]